MKKYSVISCDNNPEYYNLLPLCCYSWKKLGFDPIVIFVNMEKSLKKSLADACRFKFNEAVYEIWDDSVSGVKDSTIAQLNRIYLAIKHSNVFKEVDIIVTGDVDMIQAKDIFSEHLGNGFVNWGYDLTGFSEYPICYNAATAKVWQEVMGEYRIPEAAYSDKWETFWSTDQQLLTKKIKEYGVNKVKVVHRGNKNKHGLPTSRWDRHDWSHIPDEIIDVHMKRNDPQAQLDVFHKLWPNDDDTWLRKFLNVPSEKRLTSRFDLRKDKFGFLENVSNWCNHRPLLLIGLLLTEGRVIEFGCGDGSTNHLREYCNDNKREFLSYDNNRDWAQKCMSFHVTNWDDETLYQECGLFFCDESPGEHRIESIRKFKDKADVIVIHDTEEGGAGDYKFDRIWPLFKYRLNYNRRGGGAGASMVSNKIDLSIYKGTKIGEFEIE